MLGVIEDLESLCSTLLHIYFSRHNEQGAEDVEVDLKHMKWIHIESDVPIQREEAALPMALLYCIAVSKYNIESLPPKQRWAQLLPRSHLAGYDHRS